MATMPAVVLGTRRDITLAEWPAPRPRPDQVLIEVDLCGICGSDLHSPDLPQVYRGGFVLGHEPSGTISWVGAAVDGWKAGQRVAVNPNGNVCGSCEYCRAGRPNFCHQATMETAIGLQADGALAPVLAVSPKTLRQLPHGMGQIEAAWVEPAATALRALEMAGDLAGRTVLVTGGGPIGQLACRIAVHRGAGQVVLVEPADERRRFAGASHAGLALTVAEAARLTGELRIDVAIECSGSAAAAALAVDALLPGGVLVVVGAGTGPGLEPTALLLKELTVRGSFTYTDEFDRAIDMLASGAVEVADLTTAVVPLRDALAAFESLRAARTMKVLIAPNG
jgi:threonine dehydrogenase-like Zn-dependent dehydrogenase